MITDALLRVSDAQAITGDAASTNTIDLGTARDIGAGEPLFMVFTVTEAFNNLTSLAIQIITSDAANLGTPTVRATQTVLLAGLTVGAQFVVPVPPIIGSLGQRYMGAYYDVTGTNPSTGKITADIVETYQDVKKNYASGFTVA